MVKNIPLKLERIAIIINTVKRFQCRRDLTFFQKSHCFIQSMEIVLCCLLRKYHIVIPVQAHQIVLGFFEHCKKLLCNNICFFPVVTFRRKAVESADLFGKYSRCFLGLLCFFQKEGSVGSCLHAEIHIKTLNTSCEHTAKINRRQCKAVHCHDQTQIKLMVEFVNLFFIYILIIVLGMIVILHKRTAAEIIDKRRDS